MAASYLGEICSAAAALSWSTAVILFRKCGAAFAPIDMNFFKNVVGLTLFLVTIPLMGETLAPPNPLRDWLMLMLAGVIGVSLADSLFFYALNKLGAGFNAILACLFSPTVILLSYLFLHETLTALVFVGAGLIASGIVVSAEAPSTQGLNRREFGLALTAGILSILLMAVGIVMTKEILDRSPIMWTVMVRLTGGILGLLPFFLFSRKGWRRFRIFRPSPAMRYLIPGALIGSYGAYILWIAGMKYTSASIASILNQLSTIFTIILAAIFLKERITTRRLLALLLAMGGAIMVIFK